MNDKDELFYTAEGLRQVSVLIQAEIDRGTSQKALAAKSGIGASTIGKILLNLYNHDDRITAWVKPTTLMMLAPCITNPLTGEGFTPAEFLSIASCYEIRDRSDSETKEEFLAAPDPDPPKPPYPKSVAEIRRHLKTKNLQEFATEIELPVERLIEILTSADPKKAMPDWAEVLKIAGGIYEDRISDPLIKLYAAEAEARKNQAKLAQVNQ